MLKLEEALQSARKDAKSYDKKATTARHDNRSKDADYYEGVAQGIRLALISIESKLKPTTQAKRKVATPLFMVPYQYGPENTAYGFGDTPSLAAKALLGTCPRADRRHLYAIAVVSGQGYECSTPSGEHSGEQVVLATEDVLPVSAPAEHLSKASNSAVGDTQVPPAPAVMPPEELTPDEHKAALRFCETCQDGEGYDVSKPMMKRLAQLGLVVDEGRGRYKQTDAILRLEEDAAARFARKDTWATIFEDMSGQLLKDCEELHIYYRDQKISVNATDYRVVSTKIDRRTKTQLVRVSTLGA